LSDQKPLALGWKLSALNVGMASVRYRALFPLLALSELGITSKVFASGWARNLDGVDVLVIVKSFTADDIALAQAAVDRRIPVIYDLCDNVFVDGYGYNSVTSPIDVVRQIATVATAFVTPTEALANVLRDQLGEHLVVHVVPDGIETSMLVKAAAQVIIKAREGERRRSLLLRMRDTFGLRLILGRLRTASVRGISYRLAKYTYSTLEPIRARLLGRPSRTALGSVLSASSSFGHQRFRNDKNLSRCLELPISSANARRLLWYGNHGAKHGGRFGMSDLVDNRAALEMIAATFDVELVVVSNSIEKFHQLIAPLAIPSRYVEWTPENVQDELARAEIVLVPNSCDAFSLCKSANRTVLALMANRPVVATSTPALTPLGTCIEMGDFYTGIQNYLAEPSRAAGHLAIARERCEQLYGQQTIANSWQLVFDTVRSKVTVPQFLQKPELILIANLVQDIEFIRPIVAAAQKCGSTVVIWASTSMIRRWPYTLAALAQSGAALRVLAETADGAVVPPFPHSVRAVLTVADTNLGPHRFSYSITQAANHASIMTGTLQHGFENVGLTYTDNLQMIERIEFAARRIFVWGDLSLLHPDIPEKTRSKCISVGCPKLVRANERVMPSALVTGKPIIGIFENLHWHRYDDTYRSFFLDGVLNLALAHPEVTFVFKPHNAGRWLTTRFNGELVFKDNLLIADSSDPQWEGLTAVDLLPYMSGIITSPSTVALDAARAALPVAVVAHDLPLDNYAPLYRIRNADEWIVFVSHLFDDTCRRALVDSSQAFEARVILPGDAATCIIRNLLSSDLDKQGLAA
jgi:hypothetical protein